VNPITVQMLRDDWVDDPDLSQDQVTLLQNLSDETLQDALDTALHTQEGLWFSLLDSVRSDATQALLGAREELGI
jgi:hypothetical protein